LITYGFHRRSPLEVSRSGEPSSELARAMVSRSRENYIDNWTPRVDSDFHGGWKSKFELRSISKQHSCIYTLYSNFHSVPDSAMHAIRPRVPTLATSWKFTAGLEYDSKNVLINSTSTGMRFVSGQHDRREGPGRPGRRGAACMPTVRAHLLRVSGLRFRIQGNRMASRK